MPQLSFAERYEIINSKKKSLALPIAFCHPVNSAPGEAQYDRSVRKYNKLIEACQRDQSFVWWDEYPLSELTLADLDGKHVWRSIYSGRELITLSVGPGQWSGWLLRPSYEDWNTYWESPADYCDDRYCIDRHVLCDSITDEQRQVWEVFRKTTQAIKDARLHNRSNVQIEMF